MTHRPDSDSISQEFPVGEPVQPSRPSSTLTRTVLSGKFVSLAPLDSARDARDLYDAAHGNDESEQLWTYMPYGPFVGVEAMRRWLEERAVSEDPLFFAVVEQGSQTRIGMVSFLNNVPVMRRIELGHIWYSPAYQGTAITTEAAYLMMHHAFDDLGYRRVEWKCDAFNARSRQAALRLGFRFEGIFKKHMIIKGKNRDTAWFAITDDEWPAVKKNIKLWLYEEGLAAFARRGVSLTELNANLRKEGSWKATGKDA